jgi:apolipoprotein N-acyltransferase
MLSTQMFRATAAVLAGLTVGLSAAQALPNPGSESVNGQVAAVVRPRGEAPPQFAQSASATLVAHMPAKTDAKRDALAEPSTLVILLAGAVVVLFVSARRRSGDR